jgi:hypothetical protein
MHALRIIGAAILILRALRNNHQDGDKIKVLYDAQLQVDDSLPPRALEAPDRL